jgi:hypothetical protein
MPQVDPLLSVVVTSRNDNHGGTLLRRMQTFTNHFIGQCKRHALNAELVIVEWNPPVDRPRLVEALRWPTDLGPCQVRIIEVPSELHRRFEHSSALPLFQMIAKNVGIRRSRGQFILATNIDILFSDEMMRFIVDNKLRPDRMYRVDRMDVMTEVPVDGTVEEQLAYCRCHFLRRNAREGTFRLHPDGALYIEPDDVLPQDGSVVPEQGVTPLCREDGVAFRWIGPDARLRVTAPPGAPANLVMEVEPGPGVQYKPFELHLCDELGQTVVRARILGRQLMCAVLPLAPGQSTCLMCRTPEGGYQPPEVIPVLNYRILYCGWDTNSPPGPDHTNCVGNLNCAVYDVGLLDPDDVAQPEDGISFGRGFYPAGTWEGERMRWVAQEAVLVLRPPVGVSGCLTLIIEDGPSLKEKPLVLEVFDEENTLLARAVTEARQRVDLELPVQAERTDRFFLRVRNEIMPLGEDKNYWLCYRVLHCEWSAQDAAGHPSGAGLSRQADMVNCAIQDVGAVYPNDVASSGDGIRFGRGFFHPETWQGERMRWVAQSAVLVVCPPEQAHYLSLLLEDSPVVKEKPLVLEVQDEDGTPLARAVLEGRHCVQLAVPLRPGQTRRLVLWVRNQIDADYRLCYRVLRCEWTATVASESFSHHGQNNWNCTTQEIGLLAPNDVAAENCGIRFGRGFRDPEGYQGEYFRWARDGSVLHLTAPANTTQALTLDVEPGPALGCESFVLEVRDRSGQLLARGPVEGRQRVYLSLSLGDGETRPVFLHAVANTSVRNRNTWHGLDFKVLRCDWGPPPAAPTSAVALNYVAEWIQGPVAWDAATAEVGIQFGPGWFEVEPRDGEVFRWGRNGAVLHVSVAAGPPPRHLSLLLEPAHRGEPQPIRLHLRDAGGQVVACSTVTARSVVRLRVRMDAGRVEKFTLHAEGAGVRLENDPRTLSFRIFQPRVKEARHSRGPLQLFQKLWHRVRGKQPAAVVEQITPSAAPVAEETPRRLPALHLHTNACGDFTLLARERWFALNGYPEFEMYSLHIDSLFCYMAHHAGVLEEVLTDPVQVYHIEHSLGSGWTPEGESKLMQRMQEQGIPVVEFRALTDWGAAMRADGAIIFNGPDWGLASNQLAETAPHSADRAAA